MLQTKHKQECNVDPSNCRAIFVGQTTALWIRYERYGYTYEWMVIKLHWYEASHVGNSARVSPQAVAQLMQSLYVPGTHHNPWNFLSTLDVNATRNQDADKAARVLGRVASNELIQGLTCKWTPWQNRFSDFCVYAMHQYSLIRGYVNGFFQKLWFLI